MKHLCNYTSCS